MEVFYKSPTQLNGVAFDKRDRLFVSYPNWKSKPEFSVGLVTGKSVTPYPNKSVNLKFKNINAIHEYNDLLFIVDTDTIYRVDLSKNSVTGEFKIPGSSRLNDIRVKDKTAYITDSGEGKLFELNLTNGKSKELLKDMMATHDTLTVDDYTLKMKVNVDGIEFYDDGKSLLLTCPFGSRISRYEISTGKVSDEGYIAPHGGILAMPDNHILYSDPIGHRIMHRNIETGAEKIFAEDKRLDWPDAMVLHKGYVYVPAAQLTNPKPEAPFLVFKFK